MSHDTFELGTGQAHEFAMACGRNGFTRENVKKLSEGNILADIRQVLLGHATIAVFEHIIDLDAKPFEPNGLTTLEHQKGGQFKWDATKVKLYLPKKQKSDSGIQSQALRKILRGQPVFNANLLDYLLKYPHLIPEEWKGKDVFFWGMTYRDSSVSGSIYCELRNPPSL